MAVAKNNAKKEKEAAKAAARVSFLVLLQVVTNSIPQAAAPKRPAPPAKKATVAAPRQPLKKASTNVKKAAAKVFLSS